MARLSGLPPALSEAPSRFGSMSRQEAQRERDRIRRRSENLRGEYNKAAWRGPDGLRLKTLARDGWMCQGCAVPHLLKGKAPAPDSPVVDHIKKPEGNLALFYDPDNLQSVCKAYHDSEKQRLEKATR